VIDILTGGVGSGKTDALGEIAEKLRCRGIAADGFLCRRIMAGDRLIGYALVSLRDGWRIPFLHRAAVAAERTVGPWAVIEFGAVAAAEIIRTSDPNALLVIDELGPWEMEGGGHWPALAEVLDQPGRRFLFVIREGCLLEFIERFAGRTVRIHEVRSAEDVRTMIEEIAADGRHD
jgi:nucleoside-triphosphatase THEP1